MSAIPLPHHAGTIAGANLLLQGTIPSDGHFVINAVDGVLIRPAWSRFSNNRPQRKSVQCA
jgi:hypothetical protein